MDEVISEIKKNGWLLGSCRNRQLPFSLNAKCKSKNANWKLQTANSKMQIANWKMKNSNWKMIFMICSGTTSPLHCVTTLSCYRFIRIKWFSSLLLYYDKGISLYYSIIVSLYYNKVISLFHYSMITLYNFTYFSL